jgi:hypothetical protein
VCVLLVFIDCRVCFKYSVHFCQKKCFQTFGSSDLTSHSSLPCTQWHMRTPHTPRAIRTRTTTAMLAVNYLPLPLKRKLFDDDPFLTTYLVGLAGPCEGCVRGVLVSLPSLALLLILPFQPVRPLESTMVI